MIRILILCISIFVTILSHTSSEVDWSPYITFDDVNLTASTRVLDAIPMHIYWDSGKGSFRTGILAEKIVDIFPDFVSHMDLKYMIKGKLLSYNNVSVVENTIIFSHLLAAVKHLALITEDIQMKLQFLRGESSAYNSKLTEMKDILYDWKSASEIQSSRLISELKVKHLQRIIEYEVNRFHLETNITSNYRKVSTVAGLASSITRILISIH